MGRKKKTKESRLAYKVCVSFTKPEHEELLQLANTSCRSLSGMLRYIFEQARVSGVPPFGEQR